MDNEDKIRIGVSSCLIGREVRFDGQHKRDSFVTDALTQFVELHPVCPEVESGMPIPRPTIRLLRTPDRGIRLVESKDNEKDHTDAMVSFSKRRIGELEGLGLCGYIFKSKSPSCGVHRIPVYPPDGQPKKDGRGLFAEALIEAFPLLPVEEEGRLRDAGLRENFIERVFAYSRLKKLFDSTWTIGDLVAFHSREKLLLLAHKATGYKALGRLVAVAKERDRTELENEYRTVFLESLAVHATRGTHVNVMQHILGYFKEDLEGADRRAILETIDDYHNGLVPLIAPVTLLRFFVRRYRVDYLEMQTYLSPHPKELMLRNRV